MPPSRSFMPTPRRPNRQQQEGRKYCYSSSSRATKIGLVVLGLNFDHGCDAAIGGLMALKTATRRWNYPFEI